MRFLPFTLFVFYISCAQPQPSLSIKSNVEQRVKSKPTEGPRYPAFAKASGIQGRVVLYLRINENGDVFDVELKEGPKELKDAAIAYAKQWKFYPAIRDGVPAPSEFWLDFYFKP